MTGTVVSPEPIAFRSLFPTHHKRNILVFFITLTKSMKMKKTLVLLALLPAILFSSVSAQSTSYTPETEAKIKAVENNLAGWVQTGSDDRWNIFDRMKKYGVNGVSIAVIHDYKIVWAKGYGMADVSEKRPVTDKTLFQAASISKSLNSLGVLKLVESGKISCDSDINKYLKSWKFPYDDKSNGKVITVKELLSHTAGLTVHGFPGYERGKKIPTVIQVLNGEKPANTAPVRSFEEPGKNFVYSGGGTTILQLMVTDQAGMPRSPAGRNDNPVDRTKFFVLEIQPVQSWNSLFEIEPNPHGVA